MDSPKKYYVYAYLRAKDSSHGKVGTPYYIGKGKRYRAFLTKRFPHRPEDSSNIVFLAKEVSEVEAFQIEVFFIYLHGRINNGTGCLQNRTNGGEGGSGRVVDDAHRLRIGALNRGKKHSPETRKKISESKKGQKISAATIAAGIAANRGKKMSAEFCRKIGERTLGRKASPETLEKMRIAGKNRTITPEWRKNLSLGQIRRWANARMAKDSSHLFLPPEAETQGQHVLLKYPISES